MDHFEMHVLSIAVFSFVLLGISLGNLRAIKRTWSYVDATGKPMVSILVPARNEAANIERCVASLLAQSYPAMEVIVLDDNSTDGTGEILAGIQQRDQRLVVIHGEPKPAGWSGKHWACKQLATAASGELVLFTDADTVHHPLALNDAVNALLAEKADLLTSFPREEVHGLAEKLVVPVMHWAVSTFLAAGLAHRVKSPAFCLAIGQFMLYRKSAYDAVGGHDAIKSEILDDVPLAKRIKACGYRWRVTDGSKRVSCRMYAGTGEVISGFTRNLFSTFDQNTLAYLFVWTWLAMVFLEPVVMLAINAFVPFLPPIFFHSYIVSVGLALLLWLIPLVRFKFPIHAALLYPVTVILLYAIALRSLVHTKRGKIAWKGRAVEADPAGGGPRA